MRDGSKKENHSPAPGDFVDAAPPTSAAAGAAPPTSAAAGAAPPTSASTRGKIQTSTTSSNTILVRRLGDLLDHGENPSNLEITNPDFSETSNFRIPNPARCNRAPFDSSTTGAAQHPHTAFDF